MRTTVMHFGFQVKAKKVNSLLCEFFNKHFGGFVQFIRTILPDASELKKKTWKDIEIKTSVPCTEVIRRIMASIVAFRSDIIVFAIL